METKDAELDSLRIMSHCIAEVVIIRGKEISRYKFLFFPLI